MLDRSKLFKEIQKLSDSIFFDFTKELDIAELIWNKIIEDPEFTEKIKNINSPWILPSWHEDLRNIYNISPNNSSNLAYTILAVDGSQIYPDHHQGTNCFLINVGLVALHYDSSKSSANFENVPYIFTEDNTDSISADIVDCKRQELELQHGFNKSLELNKQNNKMPLLFLLDGSLIFWHLESKGQDIKDEYLSKYLAILYQFYKNNLLVAGYISLPKSKELVNLIRVKLCNFEFQKNTSNEQVNQVDHIVDTQVAQLFLKQFDRTILFKNNSPIVELYPDYLRPYFFYLDVGNEIARIEIPAFIAQDLEKVSLICKIIIDQCVKGYGYPVSLAESHEQAVVKNADRDFFYHLIQKMSLERKQRILVSQKSIKKRRMGI